MKDSKQINTKEINTKKNNKHICASQILKRKTILKNKKRIVNKILQINYIFDI